MSRYPFDIRFIPNHLSNVNFRKVIGQDQSETIGAASISSEPRQPAATAESNYSATAAAPRNTSMTRNVLSSDVEIKGSVKFSDDLVVDGKIEGDISSAGNLTIGENARIKAEVKTGTIIVYGKVHGNLTATDRIELKASAEVVGDIKAKTLSIEAGAIFVGKSTVGTPAQAAAAPSASAPAPKQSAPTPEDSKQGTLTGNDPKH